MKISTVAMCTFVSLLPANVAVAQVANESIHPSARFEVASIKPSSEETFAPGSCHGTDSKYGPSSLASPPLGRCQFPGYTLGLLMVTAFAVDFRGLDNTVAAGAAWINTERFTIEAKAED